MKRSIHILILAAWTLSSCVKVADPGEFAAPSLGKLNVTLNGCAVSVSCALSNVENVTSACFLFGTDAEDLNEYPAALGGPAISFEAKALTPGVSYYCQARISNGKDVLFSPVKQFEVDPGEDIVQFEDEIFKEAVLADYDANDDGVLTRSEALLICELIFKSRDIHSLKGIEYFENLQWLACQDAKLSGRLDLSMLGHLRHIELQDNFLTEVILPENEAMELIYLESNQLTSIDLHYYPNLYGLQLGCNKLTWVDIYCVPNVRHINLCQDNMPYLLGFHIFPLIESLFIAGSGGAIYVDDPDYFTQFKELRGLEISCGYRLDTINLTENIFLESLWISGAESLTTLDLSNCPNMRLVDATSCPKLKTVYLHPDAELDTSQWYIPSNVTIIRK